MTFSVSRLLGDVADEMIELRAWIGLSEGATVSASICRTCLLGGGHNLSAFTAEQLRAAAYMSLQLFEDGFAISLVFFGFDLLALGYLIFRSKFLPRTLGVLLAIEGVGYLVNSFTLFLVPELQPRISPYFMATGIAEVALCLWLLIVGVNEQQWKEQASEVWKGA